MNKRSVAIIIPYYTEENEFFVFLQKRSADAERLPNYYGFFGGGIEEGESPEDGLKREVKEELSIENIEYELFCHYEFYGNICDVYTTKVEKGFDNQITIREGEYGKFFTEKEVQNEKYLILQDKLILQNFFGKILRDNPFV